MVYQKCSFKSLSFFQISAALFVLSLHAKANAQTLVGSGGIQLPTPTLPQTDFPDFSKINTSQHCFSFYGSSPYKSSFIRAHENVYPLGKGTPDYRKKSAIHQISYHARGLEYQDQCVLRDRLDSIRSYVERMVLKNPKKYPNTANSQLRDFQAHAEMMVRTPNAFGDSIDRCFDSIKTKWLQCGGKYARTAHYMESIKTQLRVQVMPSYFFVSNSTGGAIWAAGMADLDKRTIFAIAPQLHSSGYTRTFESLVCWELGNTFGLNMNYYPRTLQQEIGHQSPCGR